MKGNREKEPLLVLYDSEEEYTLLMSDYMRNYPGLPWRIHAYSGEEELFKQEESENISILLVSESSYTDRLKMLNPQKMIILNEFGYEIEGFETVDKYQAAEIVLQIIIQFYLEIAGELPGRITTKNTTRFIGVYSPIKRCLQTTFSVTLSEILAEKHRTLYLNFESYCGIAEMLSKDGENDLSDLIYFLNVDAEKFNLHLQTMLKRVADLEYVPPIRYGQNLLTITESEWMNLLKKISETEMFDYVVMDLTDSIQGIPEILRICNRVYTITRDDDYAKIKMAQYENMMIKFEYEDVVERTERFVFPKFKYLPITADQYTRGDLADYIREKMEGVL